MTEHQSNVILLLLVVVSVLCMIAPAYAEWKRRHPREKKDAAGTPYSELFQCCGEPLSEWGKRGMDDFLKCPKCGTVSKYRFHYEYQRDKARGRK